MVVMVINACFSHAHSLFKILRVQLFTCDLCASFSVSFISCFAFTFVTAGWVFASCIWWTKIISITFIEIFALNAISWKAFQASTCETVRRGRSVRASCKGWTAIVTNFWKIIKYWNTNNIYLQIKIVNMLN